MKFLGQLQLLSTLLAAACKRKDPRNYYLFLNRLEPARSVLAGYVFQLHCILDKCIPLFSLSSRLLLNKTYVQGLPPIFCFLALWELVRWICWRSGEFNAMMNCTDISSRVQATAFIGLLLLLLFGRICLAMRYQRAQMEDSDSEPFWFGLYGRTLLSKLLLPMHQVSAPRLSVVI